MGRAAEKGNKNDLRIGAFPQGKAKLRLFSFFKKVNSVGALIKAYKIKRHGQVTEKFLPTKYLRITLRN